MFNTTWPKNPVVASLVTTAGGAVGEVISLPNVLATDVVMAVLHTEGAVAVTVVRATAAAGSVTVEFSADPSTDHVVNLLVFRPEL